MANDRRKAAEGFGNDANAKMAEAAGRSGVTRVQVALVFDDEFERREACLEPRTQARFAARRIRRRAHQA
jgi:hypothetical protein